MSEWAELALRVGPGDGLVARHGEAVLVLVGIAAGQRRVAEELLDMTAEAAAVGGDLGRRLSRQVAGVIAREEPEAVPSFCLMAPASTGTAVVVHGDAEVDFDRLTANRTRGNPLLILFTGKHHVTVTARVAAVSPVGAVHVDSVQFDGVEVPRIALEYFANRYLQPKFGNAAGLDSTFPLRAHIATVIVGADKITITQR